MTNSNLQGIIDHIARLQDLRSRLENIHREVEVAGYQIQVTWMDEYGGSQSILLNRTDRLTIREQSSKVG